MYVWCVCVKYMYVHNMYRCVCVCRVYMYTVCVGLCIHSKRQRLTSGVVRYHLHFTDERQENLVFTDGLD